MLINLNTLNHMFAQNPDKSHILFNSRCQSCGRDVTIDICHLSTGYGLSGGAIYETGPERLVAKCEACYRINHDLENQDE